MKILKITGVGDEILNAISNRSKAKAQKANAKQAQNYLNYCIKTGDEILINYAKRKLAELN